MRAFACGVLLVVGCHRDDPPPPPPPPAPAPAPAPKKVMPAAGDKGSCTLHVTGAFTGDETIPGSSSSAASKYWLTDEQRGATPMPALTVNCSGKDVRVSIVSSPNASVPFGPRTYAVQKNGDLVLLGRAGKSLADFAGTVDVTELDATHIAGTIKVTAKQIGGGAVAIDGSFDLRK